MYKYCYLFLLFIIYAIIGWLIEVINTFIHEKKFVNRGFMIGPYVPIYADGALLIIYLLKDYTDNVLVLFILSSVICMVLEYTFSFIMEKLFNARWWDYSNRKFNINGRICLETTVPFGIGGTIAVYIVNPFLMSILNKLSHNLVIIFGIILATIFFTDLIISIIVVSKFKNVKVKSKVFKFRDDTEEMSRRVRAYLMEHSILTRRVMLAFPGYRILKKVREFKNTDHK